ncbi:GFA family protein [Notoacmeibacter ruber]|uniref:GFA family protein n=1 Tax=Notoacmeibacter ruber TaxID=2670375 RepID=A0A3L7JEQ2_9HYPH|nr:GFA family protein [Notoacmeibacter ruber]RLQ89247.1 GFA family protein [Notoacmeibacter ruber]
MSPVETGRCRCGAVRFELTAEPHFASYCHCTDCRQATGAPVASFIGVHDADVVWQGKPEGEYGEPPVKRFFCSLCGSPIGYRDEGLAGRLYLYHGALDDPERYAPTHHAFTSERLDWFATADDLPQHEHFSVQRSDEDH